MQKRPLSILSLIAYCAILIKVMVFKDVPLVKIGSLMLDFGGTNPGHSANFIPFTTIVPYLFGNKGLIIAGINLVGNIALLIPLGFLVVYVYRNITGKKSLILAVASGFGIELLQVMLRVGIFDIDDVILNALGFMIGYWAFVIFTRWMSEQKYKHILVVAGVGIAVVAAASYGVYSDIQKTMNSRVDIRKSELLEGADPCGGTGGIGRIMSVGTTTITVTRKDGKNLIVSLTDQTTIETSAGAVAQSDLKEGDRVTLVGDAQPEDRFRADAIMVCI